MTPHQDRYLALIGQLIEAIKKSVRDREFAHTQALMDELAGCAESLGQLRPITFGPIPSEGLPGLYRKTTEKPAHHQPPKRPGVPAVGATPGKRVAPEYEVCDGPVKLPDDRRVIAATVTSVRGHVKYVPLWLEARDGADWKFQESAYPFSTTLTRLRLAYWNEKVELRWPHRATTGNVRKLLLDTLSDWERDIRSMPRGETASASKPAPAQPEEQNQSLPIPVRQRQPPDAAIAAYRLAFISGGTQIDLASQLSEAFGRPVSQGQVSKWLRQ